MTSEELDRIEAEWIKIAPWDTEKSTDWANDNVDDLITALRDSLERERWIPVTERLPDDGLWVEVANWTDREAVPWRLSVGRYDPGGWEGGSVDEGEWASVVTHWREIRGPEET